MSGCLLKKIGLHLLVVAFIALGVYVLIFPLHHPLSHAIKISPSIPERGKTYFWQSEYLLEARSHTALHSPSLKKIMTEADDALRDGPYSVTHKTSLPPSGNLHDFYDLSPYFWPNPIIPGGKPYYFRDGLVNPEANGENYDRTRYLNFLRTLQKLSLGYYFTGKEAYAERASYLLRVWFLDPQTRMNPHFRHSQVIPGLTDGHSLGVIRGTELVQIIDTLALIDHSPSWTDADRTRICEWFKEYLKWVTSSSFGEREYRMGNNHGTWYDASTAAIALFTGQTDIAKDILSRSARRIDHQILPDGNQPIETRRSRSLYYAIYNLRGLFAVAELGERVGVDLWNYKGPEGQSLKKALDYLTPFAKGEKEWQGKRIIPDENWNADFIPLLRMAADKYQDASYLETATKMPPIGQDSRIHLLWYW